MKEATRHHFTIPVMGIAFTIDSPLKVARYGIDSVVSLVDDLFCEQMRKHHTPAGEEFVPIPKSAPDGRARRITAYLNLLHRLVNQQVAELKALPFEPGSDICKYFELLPPSPLRKTYEDAMACTDPAKRKELEDYLRSKVVAGAISGNIMTKLDRDLDAHGEPRALGDSDALAAARGYANSDVDGGLVLSAGMNPRLFTYLATLDAFHPEPSGYFPKRLILKVSDFRSAEVQGKVLAKKGLWVSEYRIESGLNCGGHAFATQGHLMGPILREFQEKRGALLQSLRSLYQKALAKAERKEAAMPPEFLVTVQGGIGTADEQRTLLDVFQVDRTGWGTPFLLVPEATNLDEKTRHEIANCADEDIQISEASPLGVPFWNYMKSGSELARQERIRSGRSGSPCPKGFIAMPRDFQKIPLCAASRPFQERQLKQLDETSMSPSAYAEAQRAIRAKSCICHDLSGAATLSAQIDKKATPAICPGPNIVNFTQIVDLKTMVGHIYGRTNIMNRKDRPHMFVRELELYVDDFHKQVRRNAPKLDKYRENLLSGIAFYRSFAQEHLQGNRDAFVTRLDELERAIGDACHEALPLKRASAGS